MSPYIVFALLLGIVTPILWRNGSRGARLTILFVLIALGSIFVLINLISISDPLGARFTMYAPLLAVSLSLLLFARVHVLAFLALIAVVLPPQIYSLQMAARWHLTPQATRQKIEIPLVDLVAPGVTLSRIPAPGTTQVVNGRTSVAPPRYPWE